MRMEPFDPSTEELYDKIGIDATVPLGRKKGFTRTKILDFEELNLDDYLPKSVR